MRTRAAIGVVLVFAAACGKSSDGSTSRRSKDVADAAKLIDVGQCEAATDKLKAFVSGHPSASDAYLVLGDAWVCQAFAAKVVNATALADAARAYGSALTLEPKDSRALLSAAVVEMLMKRDREAEAHLVALRALDPKHRPAANFLAFLIGSREDALAVLETAYAGRSGVETILATRPVCYAGDDCGQALLLEPVTIV